MHAQLPIPPAAASDPKAIELLRVWAAHGKQHVSLPADLWDDPAAWGIMLVDLAKHVASAYQLSKGEVYANVLSRIREGFDAEWDFATDEPSGKLLD
ncbi:MAG TPA: DUF5076 domain-containing protein [Planctomycetaceae bacterium]|nr:DUF5076 domain-containing protein [Planctomycetaceae bacterium]